VADEMRALDELVTGLAAHELDAMRRGGALDVAKLAAVDRALQPVVIRLFLAERIGSMRRIARAHVDAILSLSLEGGPSASYDLPHGWRAERDYNLLRIVSSDSHGDAAREFSVPLNLSGTTIVDAADFEFSAATLSAADASASMPENLYVAIFDAAALTDAGLVVRNFVRGDRIHPLGMSGARKVKDVFIDRKLARTRRKTYPIVSLAGEVVWIPGLARASAAIVTKATEAAVRVEARERSESVV
ncbi:MAG TPA: tRNA lysidine(34) synthetase TilS, partial [Candidatus Acidoferrales bacterium]|nr:tRNA lysidine(34) synthetase TilS [Candidatus Acidoferrales bacterium]